jgi:hypothetical protein
MQTRIAGRSATVLATALAVVIASCNMPTSSPTSCDEDPELCPSSQRAATSVTCDCRCTLGVTEDEGSNFDGRVDVCLPDRLNKMTGSVEQKLALSALAPREFDQHVYQYCSQEVAHFLRTTVKSRSKGVGACAVPVHCECTTKGAKRDSGVCHTKCPEVPCDAKNCPAVLWQGAKLDASACTCTRSTACGSVVPAEEDPGFCRDWLTTSITRTPAPR